MSKTRTLKDYRPQHDEDCQSAQCSECGFDVHVCKRQYVSCETKPRPCTCGLDALRSASDAPIDKRVNVRVIRAAYDWMYNPETGEIMGLTAGDQGFEGTGIFVSEKATPDASQEIDRLKQELAKYQVLTPCVQHPNADHAWVCMHTDHAPAPDAVRETPQEPTNQGSTSLTAAAAVSAMSPRQLPHVEPRVETGAVQFGADWPGVWIRGDNAAGYALGLTQIAAVLERDTSIPSGMALAGLRGLIRLLTSSNVYGSDPQPLDSWHRAEIDPQSPAPVTVEALVRDMLTIYGVKFDDANSRDVAVATWARQFIEAIRQAHPPEIAPPAQGTAWAEDFDQRLRAKFTPALNTGTAMAMLVLVSETLREMTAPTEADR